VLSFDAPKERYADGRKRWRIDQDAAIADCANRSGRDRRPDAKLPVRARGPGASFFCYLLPAVIIAIYAAPTVTYQLPNYHSNLAEEYQPLKTLKFFRTHGEAFNKYGPTENLLLAPLYGASILYWKATGQMGSFSARYPFGFKKPLEQFGVMHFEGRLWFLTIGVGALVWFCSQLELLTQSASIAMVVFLACIATNVPLIMSLPIPRPDSAMLAFGAMSLGVYLRIISKGLSPARAFWFSLLAVFAVSAKEVAAGMFVLPSLGLLWFYYRGEGPSESFKGFWTPISVALVTGVGSYFLLNIVYAPHTWMERMRFWLTGEAVDRAIWSGGGGLFEQLRGMSACMLDNLGPGGSVLAVLGVGFCFWGSRRRLLLSLPAVSLLIFGLSWLPTEVDHYFTIAAVAISPMVAAGLAEFWIRSGSSSIRHVAVAATIVLLGLNIWYGTACWLFLDQKAETLMETEVLSLTPRGRKVYVLEGDSMFPRAPVSRYQTFGYEFDNRTLSQLAISAAKDLPYIVVASLGFLEFVEGGHSHPARAAMMKKSGFDFATWHGVKSLGYAREIRRIPRFPSWFLFGWMPAVRTFTEVNTVMVYLDPKQS